MNLSCSTSINDAHNYILQADSFHLFTGLFHHLILSHLGWRTPKCPETTYASSLPSSPPLIFYNPVLEVSTVSKSKCVQAIFSIFIFVLLSSQDGFDTHTHIDEHGRTKKPALYNGIFSTIAFLVGAISSVASGYIGMKIATYANARTALEARKGIAPAFAVGMPLNLFTPACSGHTWFSTLSYARCQFFAFSQISIQSA